MFSFENFGQLGLILAAGSILASAAVVQPAKAATVRGLSNYDPYVGGTTVCPQGAPNGGPPCAKTIPRDNAPVPAFTIGRR